MFKLVVLGFVVLAGIVAYKLWKAHKAVTGAAVVAGVKTEVAAVVSAVETKVETAVASDVTKSL